ncbi:hypothetical protein I547_6553 [Mycobacterium kansasii 824]|nr:hypothetical protein I547_6553 [Mycobacterium kansasii 824]
MFPGRCVDLISTSTSAALEPTLALAAVFGGDTRGFAQTSCKDRCSVRTQKIYAFIRSAGIPRIECAMTALSVRWRLRA